MRQRLVLNSQGMSMVEVMIFLTVISLIGLGTATMINNLFNLQGRDNAKSSITDFKERLESAFINAEDWGATVNHPTNAAALGCLADNAPGCLAGYTFNNGFNVNSGLRVRGVDETGAIVDIYRGDQGTQGFDLNGSTCNSWSAAGDDNCPFRYVIRVETACPQGAASPCYKPHVNIQARLIISSQTKGDPRFRVDADTYAINVDRGERTMSEAIILKQFVTGVGNGGGNCNGADMNVPLTLVADTGGNIVGAVGASFTLKAGRYECRISGQAFQQPDGFRLRLNTANHDYVAGKASSFASYPNWNAQPGANTYPDHNGFNTAHVDGHVYIDITQNTVFRLQKRCTTASIPSDHASTPPVPDQYMGGLPVSGYGAPGNVFASIGCIRTN